VKHWVITVDTASIGENPKIITVSKITSDFIRMYENDQKFIFHQNILAFREFYEQPQKWTHFALEGQVEYKSLLYV